MTKKRKSTKRRTTRKKKSSGASLSGAIIVLLIAGVLFLGNRLGFIDADVQAFLDEAFSVIGEENPAASGFEPPQETLAVEPVTGEWYQPYFTGPAYPDDPATHVNTIVDGLIGVIDSAQRSLDIAIFELDLDNIGEAILAARERGVQVRLVTDSDQLEESDTLIRLEEAGIPIVGDERNALMHNKFVVVDQKAIWTGSWNFTHNDTYRNNNHGLYIRSPELAQNFSVEFEEMFVANRFGPTSPLNTPNPRIIIGETLIETCFAAEGNCADRVTSALRLAQNSIHFMAFSFTHDKIREVVRERGREGVQVRGIFETRGSETDYSAYGSLKRQQFDVVQDGNPYTLHHKVFIIDGETTVLGSFNFSNSADQSNDENLLIIHNPDLAQQFLAEFERNYAVALNPPNE